MTEPVSSRDRNLLGEIVGRVAPAVIRQIDTQDLVDSIDLDVIAADLDMDALVERLDVNGIAGQLDLDALVARMDVNAIADRLDLDALVARLDVNAIADRLDLDALVARLDVNEIADRLDLDALVARLDVNAIADRLDLDALVARLDVNEIADRLDLDALVGRLDVNAIADRLDLDSVVDRMDVNAIAADLDMARITAGATQDVATSGLDLVRRQFIRIDATIEGVVDRVLRRDPDARPDAPGGFAVPAESVVPEVHPEPGDLQRRDVSGFYAGPLSRVSALIGDLAGVLALQGLFAWGVFVTFDFVLDGASASGWGRTLGVAVLAVIFISWFWIPVGFFGRTPAMGVLGLAVVRRKDGGFVDGRRAFVRALFVPLAVLVPLTMIGVLVGRERRALHDVIAGTVVVYDWGDREAEQPVTIRDQLSARIRRPAQPPDPAPGV